MDEIELSIENLKTIKEQLLQDKVLEQHYTFYNPLPERYTLELFIDDKWQPTHKSDSIDSIALSIFNFRRLGIEYGAIKFEDKMILVDMQDLRILNDDEKEMKR